MFSFVALYYIEKLSSSGNIGCIETIAASVIWSCLSMVMKDAKPMTPPSTWGELYFQDIIAYNHETTSKVKGSDTH